MSKNIGLIALAFGGMMAGMDDPLIYRASPLVHITKNGMSKVTKTRGYRVNPRTEPKIGRNMPCPCGSGAKYKKCCIK